MQLPPIYTVGGILVKKRCDGHSDYPTAITVKTAENDLQWQDVIIGGVLIEMRCDYKDADVIVNQTLSYTDDEATLWFTMIYTTPIWRVYITEYYHHPAMKCDLKGFRNNESNGTYA